MITRCLENRLYAVTANRVGREKRLKGVHLKFIGQSQVVAPSGEVLCRASRLKEEFQTVTIDLKLARDKRVTSKNNVLKDRRGEFYHL
jgi:predicted amidohydrolase